MNLVDSCGWLEYFAEGPNAGFFTPPIEDIQQLLVPTICIYEVCRRVTQLRGEEEGLRSLAQMHLGHIAVLDAPVAATAANISVVRGLHMADSILLATASIHEATLWTQDAHFEGMEGVRYVPAR